MVIAILLFVVVMGLVLFVTDRIERSAGWAVAAAFLAPAVLGLAFGLVCPALVTIKKSFYDRSGNEFVGVDNYVHGFTEDEFQVVLRNTAVWVAHRADRGDRDRPGLRGARRPDAGSRSSPRR